MDFFSDACLLDPVAAYHRMLNTGPVVWLPRNGLFAICGYDALTTSLRNHTVFRSGRGVSVNEEVNAFLIGSTLNSDPPEHDDTRAITFGVLTPRALGDVRERVEAEAELIATRVVDQGSFDAVSDLATHLPLTIVRDLVGLGTHGKEHMLSWAGATFEMMGDPRDRKATAAQNMSALRQFLDNPQVLSDLNPDGWAKGATQLALEAGMAPKKAVSLMRDYIAPSMDTTTSAIGYGVMLFAQNPDEWTRLRADRTLMRNAIEEIVRLNTPIKMLSRYVEADMRVAGTMLPKAAAR